MAAEFKNAPQSVYKNIGQQGFLSVMYAIGQRPLDNWEKQIRQGHVKRMTDADIRSLVIEILGNNVNTTFITSPPNPHQVLGVRLPIMIMVVKNMKRYFAFEVQILDDTGVRRRFTVSNYQTTTKVTPFTTQMPMRLDEGWNQISMNLAELTRKVYGTGYVEAVRIQVHANCRLRRIYFCDNPDGEEEVPADFKAFILNTAANEIPFQAAGAATGASKLPST